MGSELDIKRHLDDCDKAFRLLANLNRSLISSGSQMNHVNATLYVNGSKAQVNTTLLISACEKIESAAKDLSDHVHAVKDLPIEAEED